MMDGLTQSQLRFPIWLLGDSYPGKWRLEPNALLDPRHPTRHNIWTPILNEIQNAVYRPDKLRVDEARICITNAVESGVGGEPDWEFRTPSIKSRAAEYGELIDANRPRFVLAFGRRAYAFARLATGAKDRCRPTDWNRKSLGAEFRRSVDNFNPNEVNLFPLLHATTASRQWKTSHSEFTGNPIGNYFEFTGKLIGSLLKRHASELGVWVKI
jgi:hypothetical protein